MNIAFQTELRPPLSTVYGPLDYMEFRAQLEEIDYLLQQSKAEEKLIIGLIEKIKKYADKIPYLRTAFRVQILLHLTNESCHKFACRLADSELFRWLTCVNTLGGVKTPSKSAIQRMAQPDSFIKEMNKLTIAMTQARCNRSGKKERKRIFRVMKGLLKKVEKHAHRYYDILDKDWLITDWTEKQPHQVMSRMSNVIEQIPSIIEIAHTRIISEKKADNADKILSLYEKNIHVIQRGKMNADVEFGNGLYLAEQADGIIVDWDFFKDKPSSDAKTVKDSIRRIKEIYCPESFTTDPGFNSKTNDKFLEDEKLFSATCPRNPEELCVKMKDEKFRNTQKRGAQTEGHIGIFKSKFIGKNITRKGFENRSSKILWSLLTHNVWVIARKALENKQNQVDDLIKTGSLMLGSLKSLRSSRLQSGYIRYFCDICVLKHLLDGCKVAFGGRCFCCRSQKIIALFEIRLFGTGSNLADPHHPWKKLSVWWVNFLASPHKSAETLAHTPVLVN